MIATLVDRLQNVVDLLANRSGVMLASFQASCFAAFGSSRPARTARLGHAVGIENYPPVDISRRAADGLDQRRLRAKIAFLVGVEDPDKGAFRDVEPSRRLIPIRTSNTPSRRSRMISRSSVSMSECR